MNAPGPGDPGESTDLYWAGCSADNHKGTCWVDGEAGDGFEGASTVEVNHSNASREEVGGAHPTRPLVLVTLAGGGWHLETRRILERFPASSARFAYVYGHHSGNHSAARLELPAPGERYPVSYLGPTRKTRFGFVSNAVRFVRSCVSAVALVARLRPDAVLSVGHPAAIPLCLAGKVLGAKTVFVESLTRVVELSVTGRIMYHLRLADRLYVQWAKLAEQYPRATYAGSVL